jgi:hypothetical protein
MSIQNYIFGIDVDNTLTDTKPFSIEGMDLEETRKMIRNAPPKKGIEVLSRLELNVIIITGRGDYFHEDTIYWLNKNDVPFSKLITIDRNKYKSRFAIQEYLKYKLDAYLSNKIHFCLEDDDRVIKILADYGIRAGKVEDNFETAFYNLFR